MSDLFHWVSSDASQTVVNIVVFMLVFLAISLVIGLPSLGYIYGAGVFFGSLTVLSIAPIFYVIKEYRKYNDHL